MFREIVPVLVFYVCVVNYHKLSDLFLHVVCRPDIQARISWVLCSLSHKAANKLSAVAMVSPVSRGPLSKLTWLVAEFISLQFYDWSPFFLASCQPGTF